MLSTLLRKTELGRAELISKQQGLNIRERSALILMDGSRDLAKVQALVGTPLEGIVTRLVGLGLITGFEHHGKQPGTTLAHPSTIEFKDSVIRKTPASNFESFNCLPPTQSAVSKTGLHHAVEKPAFTMPELPTHSTALSPSGFLLGKAYLIDLVERMLDKNEVLIRKKVQIIQNERQLFATAEEVIKQVKPLTDTETLESIEDRFLECISKG